MNIKGKNSEGNEKHVTRNWRKDYPCYIGVDLASTSDLTAVSYLVVKDDKYYFKTDYYLPESALKEKSDRELYKYWK